MSTTKPAGEFMRGAVRDRIRQLSQRSYAELRAMPLESFENVAIEDYRVPITVAIDQVSNERLRIVVQAWMETWALGKSLFVGEFLKNKDDSMGDPTFDEYA